MSAPALNDFNLQPAPRILPMLGEINLTQWRCLAEFVDNSIDGFLSSHRSGEALSHPEVSINLPTTDEPSARVTVADNGPGMTPEHLEMAVRAGWSGNTPIGSLGMFGMGFNIATARLGSVTTVWTSRPGEPEECGLRIDFDELREQGHFRTPRLTRPKSDSATSGTSIIIERVKREQRAWLSRPRNRSAVRKSLSKVYSAMLRRNGVPLMFKLRLNGRLVPPINHCVWDDTRAVPTTRFGTVHAVETIDRRLSDRPFCTDCWQWLSPGDDSCPTCGDATHVVQRTRHVHGWIGLQRYLSSESYGIDFLRNGRKIELGNRDLFSWHDPGTGAVELEYPIDDPRQRGRFVGEIHLDHCRVTYMKDRFDRTDPAWEEMIRIVRGQGPLQPQKAANLGFEENDAPLFRLYQAFRRSSPHRARAAGEWRKVLVVKDNDRAQEMAKSFDEGDSAYQTDDRWWALVEEEDRKLLTPTPVAPPTKSGVTPAALPGFTAGTPAPGATTPTGTVPPATAPAPSAAPVRTPIASLTREYRHDPTGLRWDARAFEVASDDPGLGGQHRPWLLVRLADGTAEFLANTEHAIFRSATMTELDALLSELAHQTVDFMRDQTTNCSFADVLADLRDKYAGPLKLDPSALRNQAETLFVAMARVWSRDLEPDDMNTFFNDLPSQSRQEIHQKMAMRSVPNSQQAISDGRFLEYAPARTVVDFVLSHPDLFFDGRCWDDSYSELDYVHPVATDEARQRLLQYYEALLRDAAWLSEQELHDLAAAPRERVLRATLAVDLLSPTVPDP